MWDQLPSDLLTLIFSFLPPDSLAGAALACHHWHLFATAAAATTPRRHPPWFLAMHVTLSHALNPSTGRWSPLPAPHSPVRPIAAVADSLLLCRLLPAASLRLAVSNPFSGSLRRLPPLNRPRSSPAVGVVVGKISGTFKVFVAGGTSAAAYESSLEVYESEKGRWRTAGAVPPDLAVRLTVWTPNESVYDGDGGLYWVTSARAYSMVAFELKTGRWREVYSLYDFLII